MLWQMECHLAEREGTRSVLNKERIKHKISWSPPNPEHTGALESSQMSQLTHCFRGISGREGWVAERNYGEFSGDSR